MRASASCARGGSLSFASKKFRRAWVQQPTWEGNGSACGVPVPGPLGASPGAFMDPFVPPGRGGLEIPFSLIFGPDGNGNGRQDLYVSGGDLTGGAKTRLKSTTVKRFDGVTGTFIDTFVTPGNRLDDASLM